MKIAITKPLFAWDALEDSPALKSVRVLLEAIPDYALLQSLRQARGKGRDDYPVEVLWGTLVLAIALRHISTDACIEDLQCNPALRLLIGIESEDLVPDADNMSRFLTRLGEELAYHVTDTKAGDNERIPELVAQAQRNLPAERIKTLAYDKAADDGDAHEFLHGEEIKAIIQNRNFKLQEPEKVLGGRTPLNIVYKQAGTLFCYDKQSAAPVRHTMAYIGHEAERGTLKYRCPARHQGWKCASDAACNGERGYGLTVRVKQEIDLRRFPSVPRATKQFERLYAGRTAVERVNGRLKIFWGIDDGQVYGARRFHAHVGAVMVVHLAFATLLAQTARSEGSYGGMKLSPIAKALRGLIQAPEMSATPAAPLAAV